MSSSITYLIMKSDEMNTNHTLVEQKIDTVFVAIPSENTKIDSIPARLEFHQLSDSDLMSYHSIADTIINYDTINISYSYPANYFSLNIKRGADSIMIRNIKTQTVIYQSEDWWENPLYVILGFIIGIVVTLI